MGLLYKNLKSSSLAFILASFGILALLACNKDTSGGNKKVGAELDRYIPTTEKPKEQTQGPTGEPQPQVTVQEIPVRSLEISALNSPMTVNTEQDLTALAIFEDGTRRLIASEVKWVVDKTDIAEFILDPKTPGRLRAKKIGTVELRGTFKEVTTTFTLQVIEPVLERIEVPFALRNFLVGVPQKFSIVAVYNNGLTSTIDSGVTWTSNEPSIFYPQPNSTAGTFTALVAKSYALNIAFSGVAASMNVTAKIPNFTALEIQSNVAQLSQGGSTQLKAFGTLQDQSKIDITQAVSWSSSKASTLTVSTELGKSGIVRAVGPGSSMITASVVSQGRTISASKEISVITADYRLIKIVGADNAIPLFYKKTLKAVGELKDGRSVDITREVEWVSADNQIAEISNINAGEVKGVSKGTTSVSAIYGSKSASADITVTDVSLVELNVVSPTLAIKCGEKEVRTILTVTGVLSDGKDSPDLNTDSKLSWTTSDDSIATISNDRDNRGLLLSKKPGVVKVTARYFVSTTGETIEDSLDVNIGPPVVTGFVIQRPKNFVVMGESRAMVGLNKYSCSTGGSAAPVTGDLTWSVIDGTAASSEYVVFDSNLKGVLNTITRKTDGSRVFLPQKRVVKLVAKKNNVIADCDDGSIGGCNIEVLPREVVEARLSFPGATDPNTLATFVEVGSTIRSRVMVRYSDDSSMDFTELPFGQAPVGHTQEFNITTMSSRSPETAELIRDDAGENTGDLRGLAVGLARLEVEITRPSAQMDSSINPVRSRTHEVQVTVPCTSVNDEAFVSGKIYKNYCFYRGDTGRSCLEVCADNRRSYDALATGSIIGSPEACKDLIASRFGLGGKWYTPEETPPTISQAVGCRLDIFSSVGGLIKEKAYYSPGINPVGEARSGFVQRFCGCK